MAEADDLVELLFFDTFSHEVNEDINLDLVQFPKPVYITEVRIIPLGARVQADFPGGVRLGATNPSKFDIEFFVNDLGKPGASTFENFGRLAYNQNDCINLDCEEEKIPTDGLVLRGWYSTITLAVYGTLTKNLAETIASPPQPNESTTDEPIPIEVIEEANVSKEKVQNWREEEKLEIAFLEPEEPGEPDNDFPPSSIIDTSKKQTSRSAERCRTISEGNDREYVRSKREWSRSPEYKHRRTRGDRSRSEAENDVKWPRTPPVSVDSTSRPQSPDNSDLDHSDYSAKYRKKESEKQATKTQLDDEDGAEFEPILSDDEILGDDDIPEQESEDLYMDDSELEDSMKHFDPFKSPVTKYETNLSKHLANDIALLLNIFRKFQQQTKIASSLEFLQSTPDEMENFVYVSENFLNHLTNISQNLRNRNYILSSIFKENKDNLKQAYSILRIALNFECACAQPQPVFKIRHIKVGPKLTDILMSSDDFVDYILLQEKFDIFGCLFDLYEKEYMAMSIKLFLLEAIYSSLDTKLGIQTFLNNATNGYERLIRIMQNNVPSRAKFDLRSILKKINLYEALESIQDIVAKQFVLANFFREEYFPILEDCLKLVEDALSEGALTYQQPKRILPVSKKFEIVKDPIASRRYMNMMQTYFKIHSLGEALLVIVSNNSVDLPVSVLSAAYDLLAAMVKTEIGVDYLTDDCFESTATIIQCLLGVEHVEHKEEEKTDNGFGEQKSPKCEEDKKEESIRPYNNAKLGIEIAFKAQSRFHIDAIHSEKAGDVDVLVEHLHALYSQTCSHPGRKYTVETLTLNGYLNTFFSIIAKERDLQTKRQQNSPGVKYKSPVLCSAVDIIDSCVRYSADLKYLVQHGKVILDLAKHHDIFEPSVSAVLQEMYVYVKPLEVFNLFDYTDITPLVEVINRSLEFITTFPGDLIMGVRILRHLCLPSAKSSESTELKHRFVTLQLYSLDGVQLLLSILEKLNAFFEQPGLHAPTLITIHGLHCCQIIQPLLEVLREMLTFVIQCRNTEFKDLTAVEHLMKTYYLMHYYPENSQGFENAQLIKKEIVQILLAYTQPTEEAEESLHKSLWTQMIREVIKSILSGPWTYIPGLQIFAELLPLPLPIPSSVPLLENEKQRLLTERKLWSAHLHPESGMLVQLIQTICPTSFPPLLDLLTRVCLQLADLAPNMTLLISKTVIDLIHTENSNSASGSVSSEFARLLNFFVQLTAYPSVKISALSTFSDRLCELFNQILISSDRTEANLQCQVNVHRILENFFDSEISIISTNSSSNLELNLSCALPSKELIPSIIEAILKNLLNADINSSVALAASRNLIILSEHDITFFYLKKSLLSQTAEYRNWLDKIIEAHESGTYRGLLETVILFLRVLMYIDPAGAESFVPNRTLKLSLSELGQIIGFSRDANNEMGLRHPLKRIKEFLEKEKDQNEALMHDVIDLFDKFESFEETGSDGADSYEPELPQAESIVTQYAARPIFTVYESVEDATLNSNYWLQPLRLDTLTEADVSLGDRVSCDLQEIISTFLPSETNLSSECKRILHLSASPQSNRERTAPAPCFRTRRVEVEPSTGRPEKKLFVTPVRGRGFSRAPPSRGDLFRSRPPNTSRPPSLHVDDFLALETCGAQPTGPTGYNKIPSMMRGGRVGRSRGSRIANVGSSFRTSSPSTWDPSLAPPPPQHFRTATSEPVVSSHFSSDSHYSSSHFGGLPMRSRGRGRIRTYVR